MAEDFKGYRNPFGQKEAPKVIIINPEFKGNRKPGFSPIEYSEEGDTQLEPIEKKPGGRYPAAIEEAPQDQPLETPPEFISWFGNNFYKGTKEYNARKAKEKEKARTIASETPKEPIDPEVESIVNDSVGVARKEIRAKGTEEYGDDFGTFSDAWEGAKASVTDIPDSVLQAWHAIKGNEKEFKEVTEKMNKNRKDSTMYNLGYFGGAIAPSIALMAAPTGVGQVAGGMRLAQLAKGILNPTTFAKAAALGAGMAGLQPTTSTDIKDFAGEKGVQLGIGSVAGLGGQAIGKGISALAKPSAKIIGTKGASEIAKDAGEMGWKLTPGQISDNKMVQWAEESLKSSIGGEKIFREGIEANQRVANKAAVESLFEGASKSLPAAPDEVVLKGLLKDSEKAFEAVRNLKEVRLDKEFKDSMKGVQSRLKEVTIKDPLASGKAQEFLDKFKKEVKIPESPQLMKLADEMEKAGEKGVAKEYRSLAKAQTIIKELDSSTSTGNDIIDSAKKLRTLANESDDLNAKLLRDMAETLEDTAERNLGYQGKADLIPALQEARTQQAKIYRVQKSAEPLTGQVNLPKLFREIEKGRSLKGQELTPELRKLGDINKTFKPFLQGISPTAQRMAAQSLIGGTIGQFATGDPKMAIVGALAPLVGTRMAAKAFTSKAFMNNLIEGIPALQTKAAKKALGLLPAAASGAVKTRNKKE